VNTISPIFLIPIFTFFLNGEDKISHPNFDNRLEVAEIVSDSVVGTWDEFTNKSLPFDEFKQNKVGGKMDKSFYLDITGMAKNMVCGQLGLIKT
jgi:hypothetical protein